VTLLTARNFFWPSGPKTQRLHGISTRKQQICRYPSSRPHPFFSHLTYAQLLLLSFFLAGSLLYVPINSHFSNCQGKHHNIPHLTETYWTFYSREVLTISGTHTTARPKRANNRRSSSTFSPPCFCIHATIHFQPNQINLEVGRLAETSTQ
jgi:hypothetical protein